MQIFSSTLFLIFIYHGTAMLVGDWDTGSLRRSRRALDQFKSMVKCTTHRQVLATYNGYGCWCGFGGSGTPVDETDRCCKDHDQCYSDAINKRACSKPLTYIARYQFSTAGCRSDASITCEESMQQQSYGKCASVICECDRQAALCFRSSSYDSRYLGHDRNTCKE